ncbi:MAG: hypothetical protein C4521_05215 [Actinobacteria bacterium]|nr:MAG: hypothetical protein C4521_05215 [Actinomycetota bacterium]
MSPRRSKRFGEIAEKYSLPDDPAGLQEETAKWARYRIAGAAELSAWADLWPLPVGAEAFVGIMQHVLPWPILSNFAAGLPFDGTEEAAFVREVRLQDSAVLFFGLSEIRITEIEEEDGEPYSLVEQHLAAPAFVVAGRSPASADVRAVVKELTGYWKGFEGIKVNRSGGRRAKLSAEDVADGKADYERTYGKTPTTEELAWHLEVGRATMYRTLDRLDLK